MDDPDAHARVLAAESLAADDPTGWFERLYTEAAAGDAVVPWDRGSPHQILVTWAERRPRDGRGRRALVVGCGLGGDAEYVARLGFDTIAFDVAETAVRTCRERFPDTVVDYRTANLLDPPAQWREAFDLVVESLTVQALPPDLHGRAIVQVGHFVAPGGTLVIVSGVPDPDPTWQGPPWPLRRDEVEAFAAGGLDTVSIEQVEGRWLAEFHRPERADG
ncbi:MAG TPA: methyltransferase domain-containing protein [Actinophytocola sp.]|jgi:SAM-dependent methyltransferase|uniref:class I SAM-dependent methyltransferase n=1 Tax=Actinophytocola sp. TaxID=1872138 RepID=UPI002E0A9243|nr:methyltransferase domain-containing protein [Actinophytocola sp.]